MKYNLLTISYVDAAIKYKELLKYLAEKSDKFSIITFTDKPILNDCFVPELKGNLLYRIDDITEWPGTCTEKSGYHFEVYESNDLAKNVLPNLPNLFRPSKYDLPEDITFYSNDRARFVSISHERIAFMISDSITDEEFLKCNDICYWKTEEIHETEMMKLPKIR